MDEPLVTDVDSKTDAATGDEASEQFVGAWQRLVSTTNWEKGRIIYDWRESLFVSGAEPRLYSDEAWSRRVGHVSGQHVGRLRRVYERFGQVRSDYDGLYWSHFQAALDWNDAEMWLEGAVQSRWSVSQMRLSRWEAIGAPADRKPRDEDVIAADPDQDAGRDTPTSVESTTKTSAVRDPAPAHKESAPDPEAIEPSAAAAVFADDSPSAEASVPPAVRPFADLATLPDDLAAAFESYKLAILHHKLSGWRDIARDDVLATLEALKQLALAPS